MKTNIRKCLPSYGAHSMRLEIMILPTIIIRNFDLWYVVRKREIRKCIKILVGKAGGEDYLGNVSVNGS